MKSKILFIWQGITEQEHKWEDGLRVAIELLRDEYDISFGEPDGDLDGYDLLIYWEAPCTINGSNSDKYNRVRQHSTKKILLFAGGPIQAEWIQGFDAICVESQINKEEFARLGIHTDTAFGINDELFKHYKVEKEYDAVHHGTCASWKRQGLVGETFREKALLIGRNQHTDSYPFTLAREFGATVLDEMKGEEFVKKLCSANVLCQTSDYWGGGQRATLEAMACGLPVICMEDSPKNREYVEESGGGLVCAPDKESILRAYRDIMSNYGEFSDRGRDYVNKKWTGRHYAFALKKVIKDLI